MTEPASRPEQQHIGGLWCGDVLAGLADYLDGRMAPAARASVERHLDGCDWCTRFGGAYATTVRSLQRQLSEPEPVDDAVARRLDAALADALERD